MNKRSKRPLVVGAIAVAILVGVAAAAFSGSPAARGETEPTRFDLPGLNREARVRLADHRGKPVVVNFFASWCSACDEELPGFATVSRELRGTVQFIGVASLETGDPSLMPERHGIGWWPLARDIGGAQQSGLHDALGGGNGMPVTAFYDAEGRLLSVERTTLLQPRLRQTLRQLYGVEL